MNCQKTNGRIDIMTPKTDALFSMYDKIPISGKPTAYRDAMVGNWYNTELSNHFFSAANIRLLQNQLKKGVLDESNGQYVIGDQPEDELKIIMRGMFLTYARNLPTGIQAQVKSLNAESWTTLYLRSLAKPKATCNIQWTLVRCTAEVRRLCPRQPCLAQNASRSSLNRGFELFTVFLLNFSKFT